MSSTCFKPKGSSSGRQLYVQVWYNWFYMLKLQYNCLPEDEPLGLKHAEDIIKIKIIVKQRCILLIYII